MDPCLIKIYTPVSAPRLNYIAGLILGDILGVGWEQVTDRRKIGKHPVINYSPENIKGSFKINPDPILFETGIQKREIVLSEWKGLPVFFQSSTDSDIPFDIFAASFYMVTRYEEYLEHQPDEHGRFRASSSLAFKSGFLTRPVVDLWAREFVRVLLKKFPTLAFRRNEFRALLTIDIDQPFAYLGKNLLKSFGGLLRDLSTRTGHAGDRYKVVKHEMKDPYDVYDYIFEKIEADKTDVKFFFPTGDQSKFDPFPSWKNEEYRNLITGISGKYQSGLHPSYFASGNEPVIREELLRLNSILRSEISTSRFHYIRLFFPSSYSSLAKAGITEDYSMGYHDEPGFRAGIARPFLFFDVAEDRVTNLKIIPYQVMDVTLYKYKNMDSSASREMIFRLVDETRKAGGLFVSIWHNTTLLESSEWKPWRELFEALLKYQKS
jgi:hypothetical protein